MGKTNKENLTFLQNPLVEKILKKLERIERQMPIILDARFAFDLLLGQPVPRMIATSDLRKIEKKFSACCGKKVRIASIRWPVA